MEEVRQLVQEEGREARNLVAFHVAVDTPAYSSTTSAPGRVSRKPPRAGAARRAPPRSAARLRSASAGRDKRSELRARYWALLFGDLQRAIGEIYNTVEAHENQNECQEVILVLENYTRDFKALGEWFRLKWEYDNTPPPQRPQSLAWEIRKTDFVRPESRRAYSVRSSPSVSGKNSPCLSGHNTPSGKNSPVTGKASPGSGKISPRIPGLNTSTSPKANIEFFSNKIASKIATKPEPKVAKETRLSDIKEKDIKDNFDDNDVEKVVKDDAEEKPAVELGKAVQIPNASPIPVVVKSPKHDKTKAKPDGTSQEMSSQAKAIVARLDAMETDFLTKQLLDNNVKNDNLLNSDKEFEKTIKNDSEIETEETKETSKLSEEKDGSATDSPVKSEDNFGDVSNDSSPSSNTEAKDEPNAIEKTDTQEKTDIMSPSPVADSKNDIKGEAGQEKDMTDTVKDVKEIIQPKDTTDQKDDKEEQDSKKVEAKFAKPAEVKPSEVKPSTRPAYSQAAAKPKAVTPKPEVKPPIRSTPIVRSKTVVEIPNTLPKTRPPFPKRNQTNKCSYPFNLTTGRTSLFDTNSSVKVVAKKPTTRSVPGSGDAKVGQNKTDPKKRPPRPATLKINEKGDKTEKSALTLEKIKDCDEYSSSDTIVTQIDMSRIESSESLKTLVPEEGYTYDVANSVEVLNVDNIRSDNEEWLTVKSRRLSRESKKQSKSHWANRFHQPSATTSLPTLNMMESPKQENNPVVKPTENKFDRAKSEQPEKVTLVTSKPVKVKVAKPKEKLKDPAIIRQKSDVTGLKTRSSKNKVAKKSERAKDNSRRDGELTKSRLHSSLESLTTGLERSQESTEEVFDFDKWKEEFKSRFNCFDDDDQISNHNEILKSADPSEMSEIAEMTSQIEENERKMSLALDFQSDADQRKLCAEEDLLNRQILELQQVSDIDMDTETDDTETDAEILCEDTNTVPSCPSPENLGPLAASLEHQYETALAGMSWAERVDTLVVLEALVARDPGRAQQLHAKLSQGIKRRGSLQDALRRLQAKQARAEKQRQQYQTERARKIHQLLARVEEVKVAKNQLIEEKRLRLERRLQKAAENRDQHLKDIVRKAHDEEEKLREIAFIKQLEAENRRHDFLDQCRAHTTRLRSMRRDRLDRLEQKAAREAAVGARRLALEAARKLHVETLLERRKERDARAEELKGIKKQERDDAAREKAQGVKSRLSALAAAASLEAAALRSRIRDKQDASQLRLDRHLQAIREKATGPRQPTTSESQEDPTIKEERELQEEAERVEQERREREKQKAIKKRARKVKQKLLSTGCESAFSDENMPLEAIFPTSHKMYKVLQQLANILTPLLNTEDNATVDDVDKNNKKNKNKNNNNKIANGNVANGHNNGNKKNKKQKSEEKELVDSKTENGVENNNNTKAEIIIESKESTTTNGEGKSEGNNSNNNKKKARKNKNNDNKPKLSKTSSVCSSLSDMSKTSCKSDKKTRVIIDTNYLDRQLNELHRMMEKFDKNAKDKGLAQKMHGLKTLGQLLAVAADRDDVASQITTKTLTTAVMVISRVIAHCTLSAAYFMTSNACVHAVTLLADTLDKDLQSDPKELELSKQLSDCLSIALDCVTCSTRLHEDSGDPQDAELLTALRGRAHTLISYLCLSSCVARAENAGEARENVHTLLTVCADLCLPCDVDVGSERASATQSLRCAFGTSICGARAELCMVFAGDIEQCGGFVRAARTTHLLRATAELDESIVQEAFGEGGWPLEFRAAVARLMSQYAPNDRESPRNTMLRMGHQRLDQTLAETMVLDLIVLIGFVVVNNPQLQETICEGWSVIKTLCTLPANWLVSKPHCHALLPTLIALADWPSAAAAISSELSMKMLTDYLDTPEAQKVKLLQVIKQGRAKKTSGKK